jgi:hypothetical protein
MANLRDLPTSEELRVFVGTEVSLSAEEDYR